MKYIMKSSKRKGSTLNLKINVPTIFHVTSSAENKILRHIWLYAKDSMYLENQFSSDIQTTYGSFTHLHAQEYTNMVNVH